MNYLINPCNEFEKIAPNQFGAKTLSPKKFPNDKIWRTHGLGMAMS